MGAAKKMTRRIRAWLRRRLLMKHGIAYLAETRQGTFAVDPADLGVGRQLLREGAYDAGVIDLLSRLAGAGSDLLFVGSHIGAILVPMAKTARRVIGYEADPKNYGLLRLNLLLNDVRNAQVHNLAVGEEPGRVTIRHRSDNTGNSQVGDAAGPVGGGSVEMVRLDDHFGDLDLDLVVMDIEGYEPRAIRGASRTLGRARYLYVEYYPTLMRGFSETAETFADAVSPVFSHMHLLDGTKGCLKGREWVDYLRSLKPGKGWLANLLFSREDIPKGILTGPDPK